MQGKKLQCKIKLGEHRMATVCIISKISQIVHCTMYIGIYWYILVYIGYIGI